MMTKPALSLSIAQARNLALVSQGFDQRLDGAGAVSAQRILKMIRQTGMLQIDSVNVLSRAHYMPVFSRLGVYDPAILDQMAWGTRKQRRLFEYWGHEASMIPLEYYPLYRWRMEDARDGIGTWGRVARIAREQPERVGAILARIAADGPLAASDLEEGAKADAKWWGWSDGKTAMEYLFWSGQVAARLRRGSFEREYDLPDRVIGTGLTTQDVARDDAQRQLIAMGVGAMGVASEADLRKYFRLPTADAKLRIAEMVEEGTLEPAMVEGWKQTGYVAAGINPRRRASPTALLVPFDPIMWERDRVERIFGFNYRIEIYVPAEKRQHGYYVLPFMQDGRFVARLDLKTDRKDGVLRVQSAYIEEGCDASDVAGPLCDHLARLAAFLGMGGVHVRPDSDFARYLEMVWVRRAG